MSRPPALVLLAAGAASRFGGGKLDAMLNGKPLGRHALDALLALDAGKPVIVTGDAPPAFAREAQAEGLAQLLNNPQAAQGMASSVALAARHAAQSGAPALLLTLADMPLVRPETLRALLDSTAPAQPAATQQEHGGGGIPACFPADWLLALQNLAGDRGAASLLKGSAAVYLVAPQPGELTDIDRPEDLTPLSRA